MRSMKAKSSDVRALDFWIRCVSRADPEMAGFRISGVEPENALMFDIGDA